jgi:hypothetical protein
MHLQQTKKGSRGTGGPQYYFHNLTDSVKTYLRKKGAVRGIGHPLRGNKV